MKKYWTERNGTKTKNQIVILLRSMEQNKYLENFDMNEEGVEAFWL